MTWIETARLRLRNVAPKDVDSMCDYRSNEACARYQRGQARDREGIAALIERRKGDGMSDGAPFMLAVALKDTDEMVGEIVVMPEDGVLTMGYTFSYRRHRRGYAFESLSALIDHLHERYPERGFVCFTEPENVPSMALLEKLGYRNLGYDAAKGAQVFGKWISPACAADRKA